MSWWRCRAERTLDQVVPAPVQDVRDFYVDLDKIKLVHPLVVSVRTVARTERPDGYEQTYEIRDRIPLGPFTLKTRYVAVLNVPVAGDVTADSRQSPGVRLHTVVSFDAVDAGTRVTERMRIEAPRPLAGVTVREAVNAHTEMLVKIARHFG
ncbi:MAG: hypothetical protein QOH57_3309 [Mycobacterium sp.]|jgi:hypothetical protein|nr:hypothetical protein [Mycobacterium sp.]